MTDGSAVPDRRLGEGYEAHVDEIDGRLMYSLPVESGFASSSFEFEIGTADLQVLQVDRYRRAAFYVVLHTVLQRSTIRGNRQVEPNHVRAIVNRVLHSPPADLSAYLAEISRAHNIALSIYISQELQRHR